MVSYGGFYLLSEYWCQKKIINLHIYGIHLLNRYKTVVSHLNATIFNAGWMASVETYILKDFSRFVVSFDIQNGFVFESFSFEQHCVEESNLFLWYFGLFLMVGWNFFSLFIELNNRSPAAEERCVTTLYTDNNKDTNGEHTMRKFNVNSLYWLPYIF